MKTKRLLKLAKFLRTVDPDKFDMSVWTHSCGSPACALGWATTIFKKEDFHLRRSSPNYRGYFGLSAGEVFFGMSSFYDAVDLFGNTRVTRGLSPKQVAGRIERLIKRKTKQLVNRKAK